MKVVSWNINGLRAVLRSGQQDLRALLDSLGADIICFQETKTSRVRHNHYFSDILILSLVSFCNLGDQLDETLYLVKGYNAYFSFCQTKKGYSGIKHLTICTDCKSILISGVVTFCRDSVTPVAAEEGLTGIHSSSQSDSIIKCYGDHSQFTDDEVVS